MDRKTGVKSIGIRCPIIREGDDLKKIVVDSVIDAVNSEGLKLNNGDIIVSRNL